MIVGKRCITPRRTSPYISTCLSSNRTGTSYVLNNELVSFEFRDDPIHGIRLYSFTSNEALKTWYNKSRSLWKIGLRKNLKYDTINDALYDDTTVLYPSIKYFDNSTTTKYTGTDSTYYLFKWNNYPYDYKYPDKKCNIYLTASLGNEDSYVEFSIRIVSSTGVPITNLDKGCIIAAVGMPEIVIEKDEDTWEEDVFVIGSHIGDCTRNPIKYLDSPRFNNESINYKEFRPGSGLNYKFEKGGIAAGSSPARSAKRINLGSPGWMSIPLYVFGNRAEKSGFLYYALDSTGIHAKNFQAWSNGRTLHMRAWDLSDHEIDPYGVGGKNVRFQSYSQDNTLGWTVRIRPFKSRTKWVDWYGPLLYKEETVPELEELGWVPKSFYQRYLSGQLDIEEVEVPYYASAIGHLSGDINDIQESLGYYQDLYNSISTQDITPRIFVHLQETSLNSHILPDQNQKYYGWTTWATGGSGIATYKSPDYAVNSTFSTGPSGANRSGIIDMFYLPFIFIVSSGSSFATDLTTLDIVSKPIKYSGDTITLADYNTYATDLINGVNNDTPTHSCLATYPCQQHKLQTAQNLASIGAGLYHDTFGNWGNIGCHASSHTYYDSEADAIGLITHPRGQYTHYFNKISIDLLSGMTSGLTASGLNIVNGQAKQAMAQSVEYFADTNLKYAPLALSLGISSPVSFGIYLRERDTPRSDFLSEIDLGTTIYGTRRKSSYKLAVPVFSIVYGDRSIIGDWINPVLTNLLDYSGYISSQDISGYNSSNVMVNNTPTHAQRVCQLRQIVANDFAYFSRFHVYHESLDALDYNNTYLGSLTTENHGSLFTGASWSGYIDYVKQFIRIQAFEPEYTFHGTLDHLLDTYTPSCTSGVYVIYATQGNNTAFSEPSGNLDEQVAHHVRKHPTQDSWLVTMTNWSDTTGYFTGQFDPVSYNLGTSYRLYNLNVTTSGSYGTKTLLRRVPAREPDSIALTINPSSTVVYEYVADTQSTILIDPSGNVFQSSYIPVRYSYRPTTVLVDEFSIAYSYASKCGDEIEDPLVGFKAASTQTITNNLPSWMKMRQEVDSQGWMFVNSWGMLLEKVVEDVVENTCNMFLETTDRKQRDKLSYFDITAPYTTLFRNLLFNSSFSIRDISRNKLPAGWTSYGKTGALLDLSNKALIGYSVKLTDSILSQTVYISSILDSLTASTYCLIPDSSSSVKLVLTVEKLDGSYTSTEASITTRSNEWRRLVTSLNIQDEIYKAKITIVSTGSAVFISAPQLEIGSTATFWSRSAKDRPAWISTDLYKFNIVQAVNLTNDGSKIPIYPIGQEQEFLHTEIPTRVTLKSSRNNNVVLQATQEYGRRITYQNELYPTQWIASDSKILEMSSAPTVWDKFGEYDIKELRYTSDGLYGVKQTCDVTITPLKSIIRKKMLLILCKEEKDGIIYYTLKVTRPNVPPSGQTYLESLTDLEISIPLQNIYGTNQVEEIISSIGLDSNDDRLLVLNTNTGRQFIYRLWFDYYYFSNTENRLFFLEEYGKAKIQIQ